MIPKTLVLIRHAKSDWTSFDIKDFDRTLNDRGLRDAPIMGKKLQQQIQSLDKIISSTAKRASQTALLISKEIEYHPEKIQWEDDLYHAPPELIYNTIFQINDDINSCAIVCHNNGITDFINQFNGFVIDNLPTCGIVIFTIHCDKWNEIPTAKKELVAVLTPKNITLS
ncbi:MAG: histidine phosphatase family protein [Chitinophagaceae bacterium]|nr:histidine phosphatase family protein [Chitinophagaceae bacterium]